MPKHPPRKKALMSAMREVHRNIPRTVRKSGLKGKRREAMLRAVAFSKARKSSYG